MFLRTGDVVAAFSSAKASLTMRWVVARSQNCTSNGKRYCIIGSERSRNWPWSRLAQIRNRSAAAKKQMPMIIGCSGIVLYREKAPILSPLNVKSARRARIFTSSFGIAPVTCLLAAQSRRVISRALFRV